jgi:hypothetical protein
VKLVATRRAAEAVALLDPGSPSPDAVTRFIIFAFFLFQRKFESRSVGLLLVKKFMAGDLFMIHSGSVRCWLAY